MLSLLYVFIGVLLMAIVTIIIDEEDLMDFF